MIWAEKVAKELLERGGKHVIETGTSISGIPHVGNAADVIRGDAVRKALEEKGVKAGFIWISDDLDPFRKVPKGMKLQEYLGSPVYDIPDPEKCHNTLVEHFVEGFLADLHEFGSEPEVYSATKLYRNGEFYEGIKKALDNSEKIIDILNKFRSDPLPEDYILWNPICEKCGKISTTKTESRGGDVVSYTCQDTEVAGGIAKGCNYSGDSNIKDGKGKLPWRVEWALRWSHFKVTCEPLGKEHASSGGSFWTSQLISKEVFGWNPPVPVIYEFFTLNGEKMSSSRGNVITLRDWLQIAEPETLKFFMYKRLQKQRDINLRMIPNIVDEYDHAERVFFGLEEGDPEEKRRYELAQISKPRLLNIPFTLCAVLAQIIPDLNLEEIAKRLKAQGYGDFDIDRLRKRLQVAREWNKNHGPEYLDFTLLSDEEAEAMNLKLSEKEISCLKELARELKKDWKPAELHKRIYQISRENDLKPEEFFRLIYRIFIGKERGPKAALFLLTMDPKFVQKRLTSNWKSS